jgi:hypothetical protein
MVDAITRQTHLLLQREVTEWGLRKLGRMLGDRHETNTWAMRLSRMTKSPEALGRVPFDQVLSVMRLLGFQVPKWPI